MFRVVVPDCTKAIVHTTDPLKPCIIDEFLEYAQARGFHVDAARKCEIHSIVITEPVDRERRKRSIVNAEIGN